MKKVVLYMNENDTGNLYDTNGVYVGAYSGLTPPEEYKETTTDIVELAKLGYSADDILKLKSVGAL